MSGKSQYLEDKFLNWLRGTSAGASPTLYVALFNGDPTDAGGGGTEVTATIRVAGRVAATFGAPSAGPSGGRQIANSAEVDFGNAAGSATMTHAAIFDAATNGNLLYSQALTGGSQGVLAGTPVKFAAGLLIIREG